LWTAVSLGIPDLLAEGPADLNELAELCGAKPERLRQVMRILYNRGIFAFDANTGLYNNSPASELLLKDHWTQWQAWTDLYGNEFYDMARGIPASVKKGCNRTAAQVNYNTEKTMFEYYRDNGELDRLIGTIGAGAVAQAPGMVEDYSWAEMAATGDKVLDIGGGSGAFMASLLRRYPTMKGAVLDQEGVVSKFKPLFLEGGQFADVGDRCDLIPGDFFKAIPPFKFYTMKWCLHDWTDDKAIRILQNARRAVIEGPNSRFVIIEAVLTEGRKGTLARYGDITMMVASDGRERDYSEWKHVAESSGWILTSVTPLRNAWPSAIELRPAPSRSICL
jgi:gliotoxin/aspirochlorine biosynthesis O-methyltransferase